MTVSSTPRKAGPFAGNGVTTSFPFEFKVFDKTDIQAIFTPLTGNAVEWVLDSDYSITLNSNQDSTPGGTLNVITAPPLGTSLAMIGALVAEQATDITNAGRFLPQVVEDSLDKLTILIQQLLEVSGRTLQAAVGSTLSLVFPAPSAGKFLRWRTDLLGLENAEGGTDSLALQGLLADSTVATRGAAMIGYDGATVQTLLDDAKSMQNYTALRAYTGRATNVRITTAGVAGQFYRDGADATTPDNSGTVIVDALNRRWKRIVGNDIDVRWFGAVVDGVADDTLPLQRAATAAATQVKTLALPPGVMLITPVALPTSLLGMSGAGKYASVLKFKRQAYSAGQILLNVSSNTAGIRLSGFAVDCDDALFKTAGVYAVVLNSTNYPRVDDVRVFGRGASAMFTNSMAGGRINNLTVDCTGTGGNSFTTGFEGQGCSNVIVSNMRTTGLPAYSGVFGAGGYNSKFEMCSTEGTSGSFGYSLGGCSFCHILGGVAKNTSHEAFQITDSLYCTIADFSASWDAGFGLDAGVSIHGKTVQTRLNRVSSGTIINSFGPGLLCADNAQGNSFDNITLRDCAIRGYAAAPDPSSAVIGQYTEIAGVQCSGQTFRNIKIFTESGPVLNGYSEANNGAGASINTTRLIDIEWQGGGVITQRYKTLSATSAEIWDLDFQTGTPTISAGSGSITTYTATMIYRRRGKMIEVPKLQVNIPAAGTGAGDLTVLWGGAPGAAASGGSLVGRETGASGKLAGGIANSGGIVIRLADGLTAIANNASMTLSGSYQTP